MRGPRYQLQDVTLQDCGAPRQTSGSVSWNSSGSWLASTSSDRLVKVWSLEGGKEVAAIPGHGGELVRVRFHPSEPTLLCSSAQDGTVRLWDVRSNSSSSRCVAKIELSSSQSSATSMAWSRSTASATGTATGSSNQLCVVEGDASGCNTIHIYDLAKLGGGSRYNSGQGRGRSAASSISTQPLKSFPVDASSMHECHFSPSGTHLVAAVVDGKMGELWIWPWEQGAAAAKDDSLSWKERCWRVEGHAGGAIYTHAFSPDGKRLATGGNDALVGLWDVPASLVCTNVMDRRTKFIRSVAFSHDSQLVACSTEESGIDIGHADNGSLVGSVSLGSKPSRGMTNNNEMGGGADEIAFHPRAYILACARGHQAPSYHSQPQGPGSTQVTIAKLKVSELS